MYITAPIYRFIGSLIGYDIGGHFNAARGCNCRQIQTSHALTIAFTLLCCLMTVLMGKGGSLWLQLALFALAIFSYQAALVFYDAVLPQIASPIGLGESRDME